jgi:hypothetical protein
MIAGTTRAAIPILAANGVPAISIGVNNAVPPPAMPNPAIWMDPASGKSVLYMQHNSGYPVSWHHNGTTLGFHVPAHLQDNYINVTHPGGMHKSDCVVVPGFTEGK